MDFRPKINFKGYVSQLSVSWLSTFYYWRKYSELKEALIILSKYEVL